MKIILDETYRLKDKDIIQIRNNGVWYTSYVKNLDITQSYIKDVKDVVFKIEDRFRERYSIDDYMGFSSLIVINIKNLLIEKERSSDGDYRSNCDIIKIKDIKNKVEIHILTNFED